MATEVIMPVLGMTMESGIIVEWMKKEGDDIAEGEILFNVETDKSVMEVEAKVSGTLLKIVHDCGDEVPIQQVIGYIGNQGEDIPNIVGSESDEKISHHTVEPARNDDIRTDITGDVEKDQPLPVPIGPEANKPKGHIKISPKARKHAQKLGFPIEKIVGTGPGGRIVFSDVETYALKQNTESDLTSRRSDDNVGTKQEEKRIPLSGLRRIAAIRLAESASTIPHFYLSMDVDMTRVIGLREQLLTYGEKHNLPRVSVNDLIITATGNTLKAFPDVNSSVVGDEIVQYIEVNVGCAVALDKGLVVPVIARADEKTIFEIATLTKTLGDKAKDTGLSPEDYGYGTFTISNLGMYGVDQFTAIINPPEAAILAVGQIKEKAVPIDGKVEIKTMMTVTLSSDHRLIDGAIAGKFLAHLRDVLEQPLELLIGEDKN